MTKSFPWIGAALGLVAAVVFASATTGPVVMRAILLFITPLPIALAGLGWGWKSAAVATGSGCGLIMAFAHPEVALAFALSQALPMTALTYLAQLSRPLDESSQVAADVAGAVEWYPVGRLVIWAAVIAGLIATAALLSSDIDEISREVAKDFMDAVLVVASGTPPGEAPAPPSDVQLADVTKSIRAALPPMLASMSMIVLLFNLWLAGRVTLASNQLPRPWPDLAALAYPRTTTLAFGIVLVATLLPGNAGVAASAFAGVLILAFLLLGLAVVHFTTRGRQWRPFALWALYGALMIANPWAGMAVTLLGLAEALLQLRARAAAAPPTQPPLDPLT